MDIWQVTAAMRSDGTRAGLRPGQDRLLPLLLLLLLLLLQ